MTHGCNRCWWCSRCWCSRRWCSRCWCSMHPGARLRSGMMTTGRGRGWQGRCAHLLHAPAQQRQQRGHAAPLCKPVRKRRHLRNVESQTDGLRGGGGGKRGKGHNSADRAAAGDPARRQAAARGPPHHAFRNMHTPSRAGVRSDGKGRWAGKTGGGEADGSHSNTPATPLQGPVLAGAPR